MIYCQVGDDSSILTELRYWLIFNQNKLYNNDFLPTVYSIYGDGNI